MLAIKRILGWLGGKALLYVVLVLAILAAPYLHSQWREPGHGFDLPAKLEIVIRKLEAEREATQRRLSNEVAQAHAKSLDTLRQEIAAATTAKTQAEAQRRSSIAKAWSLATGEVEQLGADGRRELAIQYLGRKVDLLTATRSGLQNQGAFAALRDTNARAANEARGKCRKAREAQEDFQGRREVRVLGPLYAERVSQLQSDRKKICDASRTADRRQLESQRTFISAQQAFDRARAQADVRLRSVTADLEERRRWLQALPEKFGAVLWQAAGALFLILISPYLIRLVCYFILAPVAMRRPAIRVVVAGGDGAALPPPDRSTTSVEVRLAAGEELLVRSGYLQSTSDAGSKRTRWFLDWRYPLTSLLTGLTFLTLIRGEQEATTVSAVRDPLAEVALLTLPQGAACVLQPRALAAVVQPINRPLRVTSHWRLWSLNAWLTLQLRYLVFHGPARLVLKGGRGVRVERAERGRILGQQQVVGFSTDLAYSITRTETFWPYFFGREPLLKDRVAAGNGVLVVEEAPMAGRRDGEVRRGLEGFLDAGMKAFGL